MAPKRPAPLNNLPSASSSDDEETSSQEVSDHEEEEELMESGSESEPDSPKPSSAAPTHTEPSNESSGSESESESGSDSDDESDTDSEPIEETPKAKKDAAAATPPAKSGSKRALEAEPTDSKRPKKSQELGQKSKANGSLRKDSLGSPKAEVSEEGEEAVVLDRGFGMLRFPEVVMKRGMEMVSRAKRAVLKEKWRKLHIDELELFQRRMELMEEQTKAVLKAFKSAEN